MDKQAIPSEPFSELPKEFRKHSKLFSQRIGQRGK